MLACSILRYADYMTTNQASTLQETLGLSSAPIAIGFSAEPPAGLEKWERGPVPAGCAFWREALNGRSFYTVPADHYNCAVGAYTHGIGLPPERGSELDGILIGIERDLYVLMAELATAPANRAKLSEGVTLVTAAMVEAVERYGDEVRSRHFPEPDHVYSVEPAELDAFRRYLDQESLASQKALEWEPFP